MKIRIEEIMSRIPIWVGGVQLRCKCENEKLSIKYVGDTGEVYCLVCEGKIKLEGGVYQWT